MLRSFLALALCSAAACAWAQNIPDVLIDWKEVEAPPPPAVRTQGLIPVDVARSSLRFGIDPASVTVGSDQVVRYVVVATSSTGAVNAFYEGIRCNTAQVKVYARHNPDSGWVPVRNSDWQDINDTPNTRHSRSIAKAGVCQERAPNGPAAQIVQDLRAPLDRRYQRGGLNR